MTSTAVRKILLAVVVNIVVSLAILEGVFLFLLHAPAATAAAPLPVRRIAQQIYRHFNRSLIQFDPTCARYDADVTYTLKPGSCTFSNLEFSNAYLINRSGLRDSEQALRAPTVIVLGDSHAMGWGVEQEEAFPRVLARLTGLSVLNAAVSSYATVREVRMLNRLDTSQLRLLVVQYSDNDLPENLAFREHGNTLPITDEPHYEQIARYYGAQRAYYPGKYVYRLFMKVLGLEAKEPDELHMPTVQPTEEAALFLNALTRAGNRSLAGVDVVVLAVNQDLNQPKPFIQAVEAARHDPALLSRVKSLTVVDTSTLLNAADFYVLDDHMKASGHRAIAEYLAALMPTLSR